LPPDEPLPTIGCIGFPVDGRPGQACHHAALNSFITYLLTISKRHPCTAIDLQQEGTLGTNWAPLVRKHLHSKIHIRIFLIGYREAHRIQLVTQHRNVNVPVRRDHDSNIEILWDVHENTKDITFRNKP
jgi:hypothetical protein